MFVRTSESPHPSFLSYVLPDPSLLSWADSSTPPRLVRIAGSQLPPASDPAAPLPLWLPPPPPCPSPSSPTKVIMCVAFCLAEPPGPFWAPWPGWGWGRCWHLLPAGFRHREGMVLSASQLLRVAHGGGAWPDFSSVICLVRTTPHIVLTPTFSSSRVPQGI